MVGPWLAEVGFELLYWIPFVRRLVRQTGVDVRRLVVISRGGVHSWYRGLYGRYLELLDTLTVDEFRTRTEALWEHSGGRKQVELSEWERGLLDRVLGEGWRTWHVLHPSLMYGLFRLWWRGALPFSHVRRWTEMAALEAPHDTGIEALLPESFAAARFYFRPSFPDSPENRRLAGEVVAALADREPVVLLNTSLEIDDHLDLDPVGSPAVLRLLDGVSPAANLHVQSVAVARARIFAGTYGGLSYLAPLYGVPSVAYASSARELNPTHLDLERRLLPGVGGSLAVLDGATRHLVGALAGAR